MDKVKALTQRALAKNPETGNYALLDDGAPAAPAPLGSFEPGSPLRPRLLPAAKEKYDQIAQRSQSLSRGVLDKTGITPEDLSKVHRVPAFVAIAAIIINLLLIFSRYNTGWVKGFMKIDGNVRSA